MCSRWSGTVLPEIWVWVAFFTVWCSSFYYVLEITSEPALLEVPAGCIMISSSFAIAEI